MFKYICIVFVLAISLTGCDSDRQMALEEAILSGEVGKLDLLLKEGADPNGVLPEREVYPLELAADMGRGEMVALLLKAGAYPDSAVGETKPLWLAIEAVSEESAVAIAEAGAAVSEPGPDGEMPLFVAVMDQSEDLVQVLLDQGAAPDQGNTKETPLHAAAGLGNTAIIMSLSNAGAYVNARDEFGETPIFEAARQNMMPALELLYQLEADLDHQNSIGETVLHEAVYYSDSLLVERLIEYGAPLDIADDAGDTPLHRAAEAGDTLKAGILVRNGASVGVKNKDGLTPRGKAMGIGKPDVVKWFLGK